jgi:hypothetical protein
MEPPLRQAAEGVLTNPSKLSPYSPATTLLASYSKELKTSGHTKAYTWVMVAGVCILARAWEPPECPSVVSR